MNFVQPIRDQETIDDIKRFFRKEFGKQGERNCMMFVLGINTGLRIQDILKFCKRDVIGDQIVMNEMKTGKRKIIQINPTLKRELKSIRLTWTWMIVYSLLDKAGAINRLSVTWHIRSCERLLMSLV